jgi:hypothetical protein
VGGGYLHHYAITYSVSTALHKPTGKFLIILLTSITDFITSSECGATLLLEQFLYYLKATYNIFSSKSKFETKRGFRLIIQNAKN